MPERSAATAPGARQRERTKAALSGVVDVLTLAGQQIDLFHEYRTRLSADSVTGKFDVREATTAFPDESEVQDNASDAAEQSALH